MSQGYRFNGGVIGKTNLWSSTQKGVWDVKSPYINSITTPTGSVIIRPNVNANNLASNYVQYAWTVPASVTSISMLAIGGGGGGSASTLSSNGVAGGGGGGGALSYTNNLSVTPGDIYTVYVGYGGDGGTSSGNNNAFEGGFSAMYRGGNYVVYSQGGAKGSYNVTSGYTANALGGGSYGTINTGGGNGGAGGNGSNGNGGGGGGGAGGYSGTGGQGGRYNVVPTAGSGGGGGGGGAVNSYTSTVTSRGGGTAIFGQGSNGAASSGNNTSGNSSTQGYRGSEASATTIKSGEYGGGGCGAEDDSGAGGGDGNRGVVRIMWGESRSFPNTNTDEASDLGNTTTVNV